MVRLLGFKITVAILLILNSLIGRASKVEAAANVTDGGIPDVVDATHLLAPPGSPTTMAPADGATNVPTTTTLQVHVTDPDNDNLQVSFYGRQKTSTAGQNFTIVTIPDTQFYTINSGGNYYFNAETSWITANQSSHNIAFVSHTGDITQDGNNDSDDSEWVIADTAITMLERDQNNLTDDVPFSINPGNHDFLGGSLTHYNAHFPISRFSGKPYYGGQYGSDNSNSYSLFSVSGMHFIVINLACIGNTQSPAVLAWAGSLLKDDVSRRGIVICHTAMEDTGAFGSEGVAIYNALKDNPNWFLMLAGHAGIAKRSDLGTDGHTIYTIMADYEGYSNGGSGYIRLNEFQPGTNQIQVSTYSPTINGGAGGYLEDSADQFSLAYNMRSPDFNLINTVTVPSGSNANVTWPGLAGNTNYEWYAVARDSTSNIIGPTQSFTTTSLNTTATPDISPTITPTVPTLTPTITPTPTATFTPTLVLSPGFSDNFDPQKETWSHSAAQGVDDWGTSSTYSYSSPGSFYCSEPATVKDDYLRTRPISLPGNAQLSFMHTYKMESGYDGSVIEISTDGGMTYTDLGSKITSGGYTGTISNKFSSPIGSRSAWTGGVIGTWSQVVVDLSSYSGQTVILRFRLASDNGAASLGWYIDNVTVSGTGLTSTNTPTLTPSPMNTSTSTNTPSPTAIPTNTLTPTNTSTPTNTLTLTTVASNTPSSTNTLTPTPISSNTPTNTFTPSATQTPTNTATPIADTSPTLTPTITPTPTATFTPTLVLSPGFSDDFDPQKETWSHSAAQGVDDWGTSSTYSYSSPGSFYCSEPATVKDDYLRTRPISLPGNAQLSFMHTYKMESGYDGSVIEISTDGGTTYTDLGSKITSGGYTGTISNKFSSPIGSRSAWTGGVIGTWSQVVVDLSSYSGQTVILRFRLASDNGAASLGWYIDNVSVSVAGLTATSTPTLTPTRTKTPTRTNTPRTSTSSPTPTSTNTPIRTNTPSPSPVSSSTPAPTNTFTLTQVPSNSPTPADTPTDTPIPSITPTPTPTDTMSPTPTE